MLHQHFLLIWAANQGKFPSKLLRALKMLALNMQAKLLFLKFPVHIRRQYKKKKHVKLFKFNETAL